MTATPQSISAFSLIKLLCAITIGATLMALAFPALSRMKEVSGNVRCTTTLRNLGAAFTAYVSEHHGKFPEYPAAADDRTQAWPWLISDYVNYDRLALAPAAFACPVGKRHPAYAESALRGYSMNQYVSEATYANNTMENGQQALLIEEWLVQPGVAQHHAMLPALGARQNKTYLNLHRSEWKERLAWRHSGGMNVLCKDGSIVRATPGQSGWGDTILWRVADDGREWRDGSFQ